MSKETIEFDDGSVYKGELNQDDNFTEMEIWFGEMVRNIQVNGKTIK